MDRKRIIQRLKTLHTQFIRTNTMYTYGLCGVIQSILMNADNAKLPDKRHRIFYLIFKPDNEHIERLIKEKTNELYWGNDVNTHTISYTRITHTYTIRRQNMMLLFIELLEDEVYVKRHLKKIFN